MHKIPLFSARRFGSAEEKPPPPQQALGPAHDFTKHFITPQNNKNLKTSKALENRENPDFFISVASWAIF